MSFFDIVILALIQGITEFLPISSSGHLALWPLLTGRPDQGVTMDVAVHLGTLAAVCLFFRRDVTVLAFGASDIARGRTGTEAARLLRLLVIATIPAVIVGVVLKFSGVLAGLRSVEVIGWATLLGAVLLWLADRFGPARREALHWTVTDALLMGAAQALALVPGTSRSGITMTMARALGFRRVEAARLSLLMAVPVIAAAVVLELIGLIGQGGLTLGQDFLLGALLSCVAALAALTVMMRMFRADWTMTPFVIYRLALGAVLLALA